MASCTYVCILLFLACLDLGSTLRCYECRSEFNGPCDDVKKKPPSEELCENSKLVKAFPQAGSSSVCVIHRMAQKDEPNKSVVRGCAPDQYCSLFKDSLECSTCTTDLCNTSTALLPSFVLSVGLICAKLFL